MRSSYYSNINLRDLMQLNILNLTRDSYSQRDIPETRD